MVDNFVHFNVADQYLYLMNFMNYRDFFKNKKTSVREILALLPEGVEQSEFKRAISIENKTLNNVLVSARVASKNLREDANYYKKLFKECDDDVEGMETELGNEYDDNGGLPKVGGALAIPHHGQPIMMGKIIQVGGLSGKPASGELSGMTSAGNSKDQGGLPVQQTDSKEPITAGGKQVDSSVASKSVGGPVTPGEGQKQGGPNSQGTIAGTAKLNESKNAVRKIVKEVLKEIRFDKESGKWVRINEKVDMKMGASYKKVQSTLAQTVDQDKARTNQYEPEITEMYDEEEENKVNERYVALATAQRNLSEAELSELTSLREKIDNIQTTRRNFGLSQGGVEPSLYEKDDKWIQKAVNPAHKGYCTPMSKPTCTPHRKALAKRFKGGDLEEDVNMKMGPSYKTVQPTLVKTSDDDFARQNQYDPQVSEQEGQPENDLTKKCPECGNTQNINVLSHEENQNGGGSAECPKCGANWNTTDEDGNPLPPEHTNEAGGAAVQHSSYRTVDNGNLPQDQEQRWAGDVDEGASKVSKKISKGQKPKTSMFSQNLKHQKPKKTTSGVHKRKT